MSEFTKFNTNTEEFIDESGLYELKDLRRQHNIMCLVGNGFDRAILRRPEFCNLTGLLGRSTSYSDFYHFISGENKYKVPLLNEENLVYAKMKYDIKQHPDDTIDNWSNFEQTVTDLVFNTDEEYVKEFLDQYQHPENDLSSYISKMESDLDKIGNLFSNYLNELLPVDILVEINQKAQEHKWALHSLSHFLGDLINDDYTKMHFTYRCTEFDQNDDYDAKQAKRIEKSNTFRYDLYNYLFFNFNYTSLLDNYLYLDKNQYLPGTADRPRDFDFHIDPNMIIDDKLSNQDRQVVWPSYLLTDIIHPHGIKDIPRSFLFGTEMNKDDINPPKMRFIKSYRGLNERKYGRCFDETELFIIFGMSLERCDGWWYEKIYKQLSKDINKELLDKDPRAELIIYCYKNNSDEEIQKMSDEEFKRDVKERFIKGRTSHLENSPINDEEKAVMERIFVVPFTDNLTHFLGFKTDI